MAKASKLPLAVATPVAVNNSSGNNNGQGIWSDEEAYKIDNPLFDKFNTLGRRRPLHRFFLCINFAAGFSGVNNIVAQLLGLHFAGNPLQDVVLHAYMICLFLVVVLNEADLTPIIRESKILKTWITRGFFYTFLGVLAAVEYDVGVDNRYKYRGQGRYNSYSTGTSTTNKYNTNNGYNQHYAPRMPTGEDFGEWYIFVCASLMFLMGVVYIVLGVMCCERKYNQMRSEYQQQQQPRR